MDASLDPYKTGRKQWLIGRMTVLAFSHQLPQMHWEECYQQAEGGDPSPLFSAGEASPGVFCSVLGSPVQGRHGHTGVNLVKIHKDDNWSLRHTRS